MHVGGSFAAASIGITKFVAFSARLSVIYNVYGAGDSSLYLINIPDLIFNHSIQVPFSSQGTSVQIQCIANRETYSISTA
jgi:hypothetical protein